MAFVGVGNYLWHPAEISTISERYPSKRGFAIAIHAIGPNIGESIAPLFVGVLLLTLSWRSVLFVNLIPGIVIALILWNFSSASFRPAPRLRKQCRLKSILPA